jgi:hypothetical protein
MRFLRRFLARLTNFAARRHGDQRLQEEMQEHVALQTAENLRGGNDAGEGASRGIDEVWRRGVDQGRVSL